MILNIEDIPDVVKARDTIFHYTKTAIAVEKIILTEKLKLSLIEDSKDPIEEESIKYLQRYEREPVPFWEVSQIYDVENARRYITKNAMKAKHLCFCTNKYQTDRRMVNTINDYGYLKQRMWDQYGEQYAGVCLVLSLEELRKSKENIYWEKRRYMTYEQQIKDNHIVIHRTDYTKDGKLKNDKIRRKMVRYLNAKNKDYQEEQEIRAITFEKDMNYINIGNSIKAIVICADKMGNQESINQICEYTERKQIELINLHWRAGKVLWDTNKERYEMGKLMKEIEKKFLNRQG